MAGWCPRDDRVVRSGTTCPDCGAPLIPTARLKAHKGPHRRSGRAARAPVRARRIRREVPLPAPVDAPEAATIETPGEPVELIARDGESRSRRLVLEGANRVTAIAIAIALAFATGLVLQRPGARRPASSGSEVRGQVQLNQEVRETAELAGITLRLERLRQRGSIVDARFSVLEGIEPRTLREVFVDVALDTGEAVSIEDAGVRTWDSGFAVTFVLPSGQGRVRQIRLMGLRSVADEEPPPFGVDIDRFWPVPQAQEPRFVRVGEERHVAGAPVRLVSLLLWHDRIEVILDMSQINRARKRSFSFTRLFHGSATGPAIPANLATLREAGDRVHLDFDGVAEDVTQVVLFLGQPTTIVDGPWTWVLP